MTGGHASRPPRYTPVLFQAVKLLLYSAGPNLAVNCTHKHPACPTHPRTTSPASMGTSFSLKAR